MQKLIEEIEFYFHIKKKTTRFSKKTNNFRCVLLKEKRKMNESMCM
jgi:hypothetical protein